MELRPNLDPTLDVPLYRQLSSYFEGLIDKGELAIGERLPATRELAGQLGINRTTVSAAYELLEAGRRISGHVGRGSFVAGRAAAQTPDWDCLLAPPSNDQQRSYAASTPISFAASRPPQELFPLDEFRLSCEEVLRDSRLASLLQLGPAGGYEPLRQYLLAQSRAEHSLGPDDDILITNGCQQALDLLRRVLIRPGMRVAVEDPVYPGLKNVLTEGAAEIIGVPDPADFRDIRAQVFIVTPNFQNPTGLSLTLETREALLKETSQSRTVLIENDIYSALRYSGESLPSLKQLAPNRGGVLLRSFSKIAFPGLRLGWVIGPRQLIAAMRSAKQRTDLHSDQFSQAVMLRFAESGRLAAHVNKMIEAGRERLGVTLEALERSLPPGSYWTRPEGGLNLWVTLPTDLDADKLLDLVQRAGVSYLPGSVFAVSRPATNAFRLSFGGCAPEQIRAGIEILGTIFTNERDARRWAEREPAPALV